LSFFTNGVHVINSSSAATLGTQLISLLITGQVLHRKINSSLEPDMQMLVVGSHNMALRVVYKSSLYPQHPSIFFPEDQRLYFVPRHFQHEVLFSISFAPTPHITKSFICD
jgi:hypothetical protein